MPEEKNPDAAQQEAEDRKSPTASIIHDTIFKEAEDELSRSNSSLFWSGLAAGLSMGSSMMAEGLLLSYLPKAEWVPMISNFGYCIGFLIVILGRQQLFTENTLTPMLPLLNKKTGKLLWNVLRLWGIVLMANLLGTLIFSVVVVYSPTFSSHVMQIFVDIGHKAIEPGFWTTLARGGFAGWLIALMVWLLPYAESEKVWVIILITYLVGLGHFSHVIVGSVEVFTLALMQEVSWGSVLSTYLLPALIGIILGGVIVVAALNYAQVKSEDG